MVCTLLSVGEGAAADEAREELDTKRPVAKREPLTPPARRRDDLVTNMLGDDVLETVG